MKKYKFFMIIGILLFLGGTVLYISNKHNNGENIVYEYEMTNSDAEAIIKEKILKLVKLYEEPNESFKVENQEENEYYKVLNYDEVVKTVFSDNGVKELESTKFSDKSLIKREEDTTYILKNIPQNNKYIDGDYFIDNIKINDDIITADVTISLHGLQNDRLSYYLYIKNIKLVKADSDWLVESFIYNN